VELSLGDINTPVTRKTGVGLTRRDTGGGEERRVRLRGRESMSLESCL